ncbi:MAG: VWA domain-containing protein [Bacteroidota bacterium]|nr:VWA domain-containing protein [Bacteroidota bacterium]
MNIVRLEHSELLHLLWIIPIMIAVFIWVLQWKKRALKEYGDFSVFGKLMPDLSSVRPKIKFILLLFAVLFLVLAITNPQIGSKLHEAERKGVDLFIALDVSKSMDAEDIQPSRLNRSKQAISKLIDRLGGDRIGIIVFAGKAYTQLPITTDYSAAKLFLSTINSDIVPSQGTAIGSAIELATQSFDDKGNSKSIIVITDGENHENNAIEAAEDAKKQGITVHTIGMGLPDGAPIPIYENEKNIGFKKDKDGNTVITKLNDKMLSQIASAGCGISIRANNTKAGLNAIFDEINKMEKKKFETRIYADYEDRFQYFIAISILLLIIETMLVNRKPKWAGKINLFDKTKKK